MYIIKYDRIHLHIPLTDPSLCTLPVVFLFLGNSLSPISPAIWAWEWGHALEQRKPTSGHMVNKEWMSLLSISIATSSQVRDKSWRDLPHLCRDLTRSCAERHSCCKVLSETAMSCPGGSTSDHSSTTSRLCSLEWNGRPSTVLHPRRDGMNSHPQRYIHDGMGWTSIHSTASTTGWNEPPSTVPYPQWDGMHSDLQHYVHDA